MSASSWEAAAAGLLLAIAASCLVRFALAACTRRPDDAGLDCGHLAMEVTMAAMLALAL